MLEYEKSPRRNEPARLPDYHNRVISSVSSTEVGNIR